MSTMIYRIQTGIVHHVCRLFIGVLNVKFFRFVNGHKNCAVRVVRVLPISSGYYFRCIRPYLTFARPADGESEGAKAAGILSEVVFHHVQFRSPACD